MKCHNASSQKKISGQYLDRILYLYKMFNSYNSMMVWLNSHLKIRESNKNSVIVGVKYCKMRFREHQNLVVPRHQDLFHIRGANSEKFQRMIYLPDIHQSLFSVWRSQSTRKILLIKKHLEGFLDRTVMKFGQAVSRLNKKNRKFWGHRRPL